MKKTVKNQDAVVTQKDLEGWGEALTDRIDSVENTLSARIELVENTLSTRIDSVEKRLSNMNNNMLTGLDKIMKRLDDIDTNLTITMRDTEELKERVITLEQRKN